MPTDGFFYFSGKQELEILFFSFLYYLEIQDRLLMIYFSHPIFEYAELMPTKMCAFVPRFILSLEGNIVDS